MEVNRADRRRKTRFCYAAMSAAASISTAWNAYMTCCRVSIRIPLCLNYAKDHRYLPGRAEPPGCMWHFLFLTVQINHGRERRFASFIFPLYIYKDVKIPGY